MSGTIHLQARQCALRWRPHGIQANGRSAVVGIKEVARQAGVSVVGYDDIEFAEASLIPLTSVRHPAGEIGRLAAEPLLEEIDPAQPDQPHVHTGVALQPELVVRRSSLPRR
ncbi:substrate-binding domain-containing protein [Streptomyces sp. NPDC006482]|uniref:substrate-binding domain-containing protein n=1 Tax=Streptomyces sp. NPDC006482 TaxID=3154306 RepID=UPI0033B79D45